MQINSVTNINFEAKKHVFISNQAKENAHLLLQKMNSRTTYKENSAHTGFESQILSSISTNKNVKFTDARIFLQPEQLRYNNTPDCTLHIGKNYLNINSKTGEVVSYKRGFLMSLSSFISKAESCLNNFLINFDNPDVVKKHTFGIAGFTEKGLKILEEAKNKI